MWYLCMNNIRLYAQHILGQNHNDEKALYYHDIIAAEEIFSSSFQSAVFYEDDVKLPFTDVRNELLEDISIYRSKSQSVDLNWDP